MNTLLLERTPIPLIAEADFVTTPPELEPDTDAELPRRDLPIISIRALGRMSAETPTTAEVGTCPEYNVACGSTDCDTKGCFHSTKERREKREKDEDK